MGNSERKRYARLRSDTESMKKNVFRSYALKQLQPGKLRAEKDKSSRNLENSRKMFIYDILKENMQFENDFTEKPQKMS